MVKPRPVEPKEEPRSGSDEREAPERKFALSKDFKLHLIVYTILLILGSAELLLILAIHDKL